MPTGVRSVSRNSLKHQLVRQLTEEIVSGQLEPGACLPAERQLAEQFDVSRTVVREAVSILAARGFLNVRHGSGTFINPPTLWNNLDPTVLLLQGKAAALEEMLEVRQLLEPIIARLAAQRASQADIDVLKERLSDPAESDDEKIDADFAFHLALAEASHNHVLAIMLNSVRELMREVHRDVFMRPLAHEQAQMRHRAILDKIQQRDEDGAFRAMQQHIREANQNRRAVLMGLLDQVDNSDGNGVAR